MLKDGSNGQELGTSEISMIKNNRGSTGEFKLLYSQSNSRLVDFKLVSDELDT